MAKKHHLGWREVHVQVYGSRMSAGTVAAAGVVSRLINEMRYRLDLKTGKHRSRMGMSTFQWVRMQQFARGY